MKFSDVSNTVNTNVASTDDDHGTVIWHMVHKGPNPRLAYERKPCQASHSEALAHIFVDVAPEVLVDLIRAETCSDEDL